MTFSRRVHLRHRSSARAISLLLIAQLMSPSAVLAAAPPEPERKAAVRPTPASVQTLSADAQCFDPGPTIEGHEAELERLRNYYAFMTWKAAESMPAAQYYPWGERIPPGRTPLFDVRFCEPGWRCSPEANVRADAERVLTVGAAAQTVATAQSAFRLGKRAEAQTMLSLMGTDFKRIDDTTDKIKGAIDSKLGQWSAVELEQRAMVRTSRQQVVEMANRQELNLRRSLELKVREGTVPDSLKKRITFQRIDAEQAVNVNRMQLEQRMAEHRQDISIASEMKGSREALERSKRYFDHLTLLAKGVQTAAAVEREDPVGTSKALLGVLTKLNNDYFIEWVKADIKAQEKPLKDAVKAYKQYSWANSRWILSVPSRYRLAMKDGNNYGPLFNQYSSAIIPLQRSYQDLPPELARLEALKAGFKKAKEWMPAIEAAQKFWRGLHAAAVKPTDVVQANSDAALRASMPLATRRAIGYFSGAGAALRGLADFMKSKVAVEYPADPKNAAWFAAGIGATDTWGASQFVSMAVLGAIVAIAATYFEVAGQTVEAFARLTESALQGGEITAAGEWQALEEVFANHPALRGLKAYVNLDDVRTVQIYDSRKIRSVSLSRQGPRNEFGRLMTALSTWTSISGRNPDQDTVFALASGTTVGLDVPYFEAGRFTLMNRGFTMQSLADLSSLRVEEEQIGAAMRELTFINQATSGLGAPYGYKDLFDLKSRTRLSDLSYHHMILDRAFRTAYDAPITANVFGAVLAQSGPGATAVTSTSPLQKIILRRAIEMEQVRRAAPPVAVSWVNTTERPPEALDVIVGLEVGALRENTQVCRSVRAFYPDGSSQVARLVPPGVQDSPLTSTYTIPLDWNKLRTSQEVRLEVTAAAGRDRDTRSETVTLSRPVAVEDAYALPTVAFHGTELTLQAVGRIASVTEDAQVQADFVLEREGAPPVTLQADRVELVDGWTVLADATYKVPDDVPSGTAFNVTARLKMGEYESSTTTRFDVRELPDPTITPFEPMLMVRVTAADENGSGSTAVGAGVLVKASNGEEKRTNEAGVVQLGPFTEGTFRFDAMPSASDQGVLEPGSASITLTDFNPETTADPNQYVVDIVLPRTDTTATRRALDELKAEAGRLLTVGARAVQLANTVTEQSGLAEKNAAEARELLAQMHQSDQAARRGDTLCSEYNRVSFALTQVHTAATIVETDMRAAFDEAEALAARCTSQNDASQINAKHQTAIKLAARLGVHEKEARAAGLRLRELADQLARVKELIDEQKKRAASIGEKAQAATAAASRTEGAVNDLTPVIARWPAEVNALGARYQTLRQQTPAPVLRQEFAEVEQLVGRLTGPGNVGVPASADAFLAARQNARTAVGQANDYKSRADALAAIPPVCEIDTMESTVEDMGAMMTGATIELGAAADLPRKAADCTARLQQTAACTAMAADAQRMIGEGAFQNAGTKIAEMKAVGCDTSALEQLLARRSSESDRQRLQLALANALAACRFQQALDLLGQLDRVPYGLQGLLASQMDRAAFGRAASAQQEIEAVRTALKTASRQDAPALRARLQNAKAALPVTCQGDIDAMLTATGVLMVPPAPTLVRFGFAEQRVQVSVGQSVAPRVYAVFSDAPSTTVDVTDRVQWSGVRGYPFRPQPSEAGRYFTLTATYAGVSTSIMIEVRPMDKPDTSASSVFGGTTTTTDPTRIGQGESSRGDGRPPGSTGTTSSSSSTPLPPGVPDIAGTWGRYYGGAIMAPERHPYFAITQSGNKFQWTSTYPWLELPWTRTTQVTGTISGTCAGSRTASIEIEILHTDNKGSPPERGKENGRLTCDQNGKVTDIDLGWDFRRVK